MRAGAALAAVFVALACAGAGSAEHSAARSWGGIGSVVNVKVSLGRYSGASGTGIVIGSTGLVVTNNHVIRGAVSVKATDVGNGKTYKATVLGYSVAHDVAVLRLAGAAGIEAATLAPEAKLGLGARVTAFGNAGGLGGRPKPASGAIIGLRQAITARGDDGSHERLTGLIETDVNLEPGDSGGPLVDSLGRVIGMNTASSQGFRFNDLLRGEAYAIPIATALAVASRAEAGKPSAEVHVGPTPRLGVFVGPPSGYGLGFYRRTKGALVIALSPGSPAAHAGLSAGDVITSFDGEAVHSAAALEPMLLTRLPNDRVVIAWVDEFGQVTHARVKLDSGPPQ